MPADIFAHSICPICLDIFDNAVYLDPCWHRFCFHCIQEWSKFKAECLLCQQAFFSLCNTVHAEDDISRSLENESFSYSDHSIIRYAESPFDLVITGMLIYLTPSHNEGSSSDSTIPAVFPDEANSQALEHSSSEHSVDQFPWNDETPGPSYSPSEKYSASATIISSSELLDSSSYENAAWERLALQFQSESSVDSSDGDSSSEYHDFAGYINLCAERTPELTELCSDSEDSIREKKREDMKEEQSIQDSSWSDREPCRASSPHSPLYKEHVSSCQSTLLSVVKRTVSMDEQKNKDKIKDHSPHDSDCSLSPGMDAVCSPCSQRLTRSPQSSEGSHGHRPWRKHHSEHQFKKSPLKSRHGSKHWSKRSRLSRSCDMSPSLKSQTESRSCESTSSRVSSRLWSQRRGHGQRRSSCLDSDCCYQNSYLLHIPNTVGDDSSCSKSTQPKAHCSSKSPGPGLRIQPFMELHSQVGLHERQDSSYKQCRSRGQSNSRSRSPSGETEPEVKSLVERGSAKLDT